MEIKLAKYDRYKDSGVEWLGEIPTNWEVLPGLSFLAESKERNSGMKRNTILSLSYGIIRIKNDEELTGLVPESFETYQLVNAGDIIFRPTDLQNDKVSLRSGISKFQGIITSAYINLRVKSTANSDFYSYVLRTIDNNKMVYGLGSGLRQNISFSDFRRFPFPVPLKSEQIAIAKFLDDKTSKIDQAIAQKERQIELLKERRQILIHKAVTKGINPDVKLKDSGVEWIGEIPEHWEVKRLKHISFINLNSLAETTSSNLSFKYVDIGCVTLEEGITDTQKFIFKEAPSRARRIAKVGDTVISTVRTYLKAIDFIDQEKSNYIFSTGFAVLQPKSGVYPEYLGYFVRSDAFTEQVTISSKGMSYPAINSSDLSRLFVLQCPVIEQANIVVQIKVGSLKIANAIALKEKEIGKLKEYKACLINSVVTGKVKVG